MTEIELRWLLEEVTVNFVDVCFIDIVRKTNKDSHGFIFCHKYSNLPSSSIVSCIYKLQVQIGLRVFLSNTFSTPPPHPWGNRLNTVWVTLDSKISLLGLSMTKKHQINIMKQCSTIISKQ